MKLHNMRFRLAPRSMTLDDLELENNQFSSFRRCAQCTVCETQTVHTHRSRVHRYRALTSGSARLSCSFLVPLASPFHFVLSQPVFQFVLTVYCLSAKFLFLCFFCYLIFSVSCFFSLLSYLHLSMSWLN